ncbi:MAG: methylmalonyl Co-A mutase-associated GTPase MeaB [Acidobacteria bacterium]|nr:methylmalonyl Co-A mutase-associated GTPase MeaB [Acidobacteriota bacterium]MBI3656209.1 methylmalonyl Co-A mutase-associated GTPase MeaB [Acidobacteriota bacterium]
MNVDQLIDGILEQDTRAIARGISIIENRSPQAETILRRIYARTGRARIVGVTGAPGSGKSTLVDRLIAQYRQADLRVAVLAIDPSSPFTGGAILGDRIRMQAHGVDPGTYIRSMATRGHLGGLARAAVDALSILDAAGFQIILVETVGVGQDEVEVAKTADITMVVLVPGMGDDIQTMKAGLMEISDLFVINKADRDGVPRVERELQALLSLTDRSDDWTPAIVKTIALESVGLEDLVSAIDQFFAFMKTSPRRTERQRERTAARLRELLQERLLKTALQVGNAEGEFDALVKRVSAKELDPYTAIEMLMPKLERRPIEDGVGKF